MCDKKPVWREVDGGLVPSGTKEVVYIFNGEMLEGKIRQGWVLLQDRYHVGRTQVGFYNTNRTKAAKYEWLECDECFGSGNLDLHSMFNTSADICTSCKGKGYRLERIK